VKYYVILDRKIKEEKKMSRIGKKAIEIPKNVSIQLQEEKIIVKGKNGILEKSFTNNVNIEISQEKIIITRFNDTKASKTYHGLIRALVQNMVTGVDQKFSKVLVAEGIGYKFQLDKKLLILNVGFTHPVEFSIPDDLVIKVESPTKIVISGIDKEKVGFLAAKIRDTRPPEPYKGKGIMYENEKIIRKAGKTGK
jgi:large subunit ribosomal protein L6